MLNCVPVVVRGGGNGCVGKSATGEIASEASSSRSSFPSFFFFFFSIEQRENLYIWVADERKRRIRDFRNGGDGHPSFVLLPLSAKRKKEREDDSRVTHLRQIFIPKRRREIFSRSIDGSTCCLSISRSRTGLGLV